MRCWTWVFAALFVSLLWLSAAAEEPKPENESAAPEGAAVEESVEEPVEEAVEEETCDHYEHLKCLEWMLGTWAAEDAEASATTTVRWTKNRSFLARSFKVVTADQHELEGTQVIGWDPIRKEIRSWMFDSEGGFGEGSWKNDGNRWVVKSSQVLAGGKRAAAVNIMTQVDEDTVTWQSINREVDGEMIANGPEITLVRAKTE